SRLIRHKDIAPTTEATQHSSTASSYSSSFSVKSPHTWRFSAGLRGDQILLRFMSLTIEVDVASKSRGHQRPSGVGGDEGQKFGESILMGRSPIVCGSSAVGWFQLFPSGR